jgi:CRISPR/Cas system-associated protein Cas10 (large subunit of type III CRISPR-Cas system)
MLEKNKINTFYNKNNIFYNCLFWDLETKIIYLKSNFKKKKILDENYENIFIRNIFEKNLSENTISNKFFIYNILKKTINNKKAQNFKKIENKK